MTSSVQANNAKPGGGRPLLRTRRACHSGHMPRRPAVASVACWRQGGQAPARDCRPQLQHAFAVQHHSLLESPLPASCWVFVDNEHVASQHQGTLRSSARSRVVRQEEQQTSMQRKWRVWDQAKAGLGRWGECMFLKSVIRGDLFAA